MREAPLSAEQIDVEDVYQAIELSYERGWTDGLPVVPPTEKRVRAFLDAAGLAPVVDAISTDEFFRGTYLLFVSPQHAAVFIQHGWTKRHVRDYLWACCRRSVADRKRRGTWGVMADKPEGLADFSREVQPGDEERIVSLFEPNEYDRFMQAPGTLERSTDIYVIVGGGNAGIGWPTSSPTGCPRTPSPARCARRPRPHDRD
ncbi:MAG: hypothetical protein HYR50_06800, partial [Candidatus Rokubacteria bacterium]|nr:hypothetical protein [Candidatus Rokubacteria bacterium]